MRKNILLVANDRAPSVCFAKLQNHLEKQGHDVAAVLNHGKGRNEEDLIFLVEQVKKADVVLCGLSSPAANAKMEVRAAEYGTTYAKPYGFYADTFGAHNREWFASVRDGASFLFTVNGTEAAVAKVLFPAAKVTATGNPLWDAYFTPCDKSEARARAGVEEKELFVLLPLGKTTLSNMEKISGLMQAFGFSDRRVCVVLTLHPGDETAIQAYESAVRTANKMHPYFRMKIYSEGTDVILPGADAVIGPAASASVHAMARGIPLIDWRTPGIQQGLKADIGSPDSYAVRYNAAVQTSSPNELRNLLWAFTMNPEAWSFYREKQRGLVPHIPAQHVLSRMEKGLGL